MRLWFLRVKDHKLSRNDVRSLRMAPILFRVIPAAACRLHMPEDEIEHLVDKFYGVDSNRTRGHYKGSLRRFLSDAEADDLVAIKVNNETELLFGQFSRGTLAEVPGHPGVKGRPVKWLDTAETSTLLKNPLPKSVLKYRGTMCLWSEQVDLPEPAEIKSEGLEPESFEPDGMAIKFIRVGVDAGAGGRLSRVFPGGYYHFIPIPKHNDPEFCRFTYGSGCNAIRDFSLLHLRQGDVLVFYAGFRPDMAMGGKPMLDGGDRVGIFAYFTIQKAFLIDYDEKSQNGKHGLAVRFSDLSKSIKLVNWKYQLTPEFRRLASPETLEEVVDDYMDYNPHIDKNGCGRTILICGKKYPESRLLSKVEFLASLKDGAYRIGQKEENKWGLKHEADLTRCSLRTVDHTIVNQVFERLKILE
jgi:hypothetical protein